MIKLHGVEVKVGDMVWSLFSGWAEVGKIDESSAYQIQLNGCSFNTDGMYQDDDSFPALFWNEISPEAIEAAKQKPKDPVYAYQWLRVNMNGDEFEITGHFVNQSDLAACLPIGWKLHSRIEESKRLVSHE